jgi:hypothetical protein
MMRKIMMMSGIRWLAVLGVLFVVVPVTAASAAEPKPRKIYGHYMGCFVSGTGAIWMKAIVPSKP